MLSNEDKIAYLANLIGASRADGLLSERETTEVEAARKRIGATKGHLNKAESLAKTDEFAPTAIGPFSVRAGNLEDLLRVVLADGTLDPTEKAYVLGFAKQVGITNEQLTSIVSEVRSAMAGPSPSKACAACGASAPSAAKFCPSCGSAIGEGKAVPVDAAYEFPKTGIAIEFAESSAAGYVDAVAATRSAPVNGEWLKGKKKWHMAAWPNGSAAEASTLAQHLKGMRNRKVWIDGKEQAWDSTFSFLWCSERREAAYRPIEYCFGLEDRQLNLWGCKHAQMPWTSWARWLSHGSFKRSGLLGNKTAFVFDKKQIRHELETNLFRFRQCPYLNFRLIEAVINRLPDEVVVVAGGPWVYDESYEQVPGSIKITRTDRGYTSHTYATGVRPASPEFGLQLLRLAASDTQVDQSAISAVLTYKGER